MCSLSLEKIACWHSMAAGFNEMSQSIPLFVPDSDRVSVEGTGMLKVETDPYSCRDRQMPVDERYTDKVLEMCCPTQNE